MALEVLPGGKAPADVGESVVLRDDEYEIAHAAIDLLAYPGQLVTCDGVVYRFDPASGVWRILLHDDLMTEICCALRNATIIGDSGKPRRLPQNYRRMEHVTKYIPRLQHIRDDDFFTDAVSGICFRNRFVLIDESTDWEPVDMPLAPEYKARASLAIDYDPDSACPKWDAFMREIFDGAADATQRADLLAEFIGVAMVGKSTRYAKCLWLTGAGNNGKSTMAEVIEGLFCRGSVASVAPRDWCDEKKYYLHHLMGAHLNIVTEMIDTRLTNTDIYKAVVSGDAVEARPIRGNPIRFRPTAGHILACNTLPMTSDQSLGFWRRALVLLMDRDFSGSEAQQEDLVKSLQEELPGIAVWALRGFQRAARQGGYTVPPSSAEAKQDWKNDSDEVVGWIRDCCTEICPIEDMTQASILYESFAGWCRQNNHRAPSSNLFGRRLTAMRIPRNKNKTEQKWCYGLKLKSNIGGVSSGWGIGDV